MLERSLYREVKVMELAELYFLRVAGMEYDVERLEELEAELLKAEPQPQVPEGTVTP